VSETLGIGLEDGRTILHDVKHDIFIIFGFKLHRNKTVFQSKIKAYNKCSGLRISVNFAIVTLSLNNGNGLFLLAAGNRSGQIVIWNIKNQSLYAVKLNVHRGKVSIINFFESSFLLTSIGSDNSIRQWKLDKSNFLKLVTEKSGHSTSIFHIRYLNNKNCLLSVGYDNNFFFYSTYSNQKTKISMSNNFEKDNNNQKKKENKMNNNPIVSMDVSKSFHNVLCDVITAHENNS